jgi:hypothetical protein
MEQRTEDRSYLTLCGHCNSRFQGVHSDSICFIKERKADDVIAALPNIIRAVTIWQL